MTGFFSQVGETVQALHRSSRSDLFFEGKVVATKLNKAVVAFSDGRVRGQQHSFSAQDLNIISKEKLTSEHLLQLSQKKRPLQVDTAREAVQFNAGNFVVIDGANEKSWVAQLMESFVGKISTEVSLSFVAPELNCSLCLVSENSADSRSLKFTPACDKR